MQRLLNNSSRIILRKLLGYLSKITLNKHKPKVIVITGDNSSSLIREFIYSYISTNHNVRRNLENTYSEFSIPLTIFGTLYYPSNFFSWSKIIIKTLLQYFYLKPYNHYLVLQLHYINREIFNYWIKISKPDLLIKTDSHEYNYSLEININENDIENIIENIIPKKVELSLLKIGVKKVPKKELVWNPAVTRIKLIAGKNNSIIIDSSYYYYPVNLKSIFELAESFPGKKYFYSFNKEENLPKEYTVISNQKETVSPDSVIIIRGPKDKTANMIKFYALNDFEI